MKKLAKWFSIFAVIGAAIGLIVAYFFKNRSDSVDETESDLTEDEDFDLDADLQPAGREYVSLNRNSEEASAAKDETPEKADDKKDGGNSAAAENDTEDK